MIWYCEMLLRVILHITMYVGASATVLDLSDITYLPELDPLLQSLAMPNKEAKPNSLVKLIRLRVCSA